MRHAQRIERTLRGRAMVCAAAMALLTLSGCAAPEKRDDGVSAQGRSREAVEVADLDADLFESRYAALIDDLMDGMSQADIAQREEPQQKLERLCMAAGRTGAAVERIGLCRAMLRRCGADTPMTARVWLLRQLERLSGEESVARLAELMNGDDDARIRELARRALQNNSSPRAGGVLRDALTSADSPARQIALINALAARRERESVAVLSLLMGDEDDGVALAAIAGLGDFSEREADDALHAYWRSEASLHKHQAVIAEIRTADRMLSDGQDARAAEIYLDAYLFETDADTRMSALRGYAAAVGERALLKLLDVMRGQLGDHARRKAARILQDVPGSIVTQAIVAELERSQPEMQALILNVLAERGDVGARPAALGMLASPDGVVRIEALDTLGRLGDRSTVIMLAQAASRRRGDEKSAARAALAGLRGEEIDETILRWMSSDDAGVRAELVRALGARHYSQAVPTFFDAADDPEEVVRIAALESLATYASSDDLPGLIQRLIKEPGQLARAAAEDAVVAVANKIADKSARPDGLLAVLGETHADAKASMLRVLQRLGGDRALAAIREALSDNEPEVYDAAVRALAAWADTVVLDDLAAVAADASTLTHRVLALRGYVRLIRLPSERPVLETLAGLRGAMGWAEQADEKKLVLGGVGGVIHLDALELAQSHLADEALRDEAAAAMLSIAEGLATTNRAEAMAAIDAVLALENADGLHRNANSARERIERFRGFVVTWRVSGPYFGEGIKANQLLATPFAPELNDGADAEWRDLPVTNKRKPWEFDLAKAIGGGNRCIYAKAEVYSETDQPAMLELGSDDGVKVWLNGEVVHENNVMRGLAIGHDKSKVTLKQGWNKLMVKISNGGGGWGFGCGVKTPEGGNIEGLKIRAE